MPAGGDMPGYLPTYLLGLVFVIAELPGLCEQIRRLSLFSKPIAYHPHLRLGAAPPRLKPANSRRGPGQ